MLSDWHNVMLAFLTLVFDFLIKIYKIYKYTLKAESAVLSRNKPRV